MAGHVSTSLITMIKSGIEISGIKKKSQNICLPGIAQNGDHNYSSASRGGGY